MPAKFIRGALVEFTQTFLVPLPNVIVFQYNPETIQHNWTQPQAVFGGTIEQNPLAVQGMPGESFSFTLAMDARDMTADGSPVAAGIALTTGIYSRLAALELLLYPVTSAKGGLIGSVSATLSGSAQASTNVPQMQLPTVLFVYGPGRILPVRVTSLNITETLYDPLLNPIHAEAQVYLEVLTPQELVATAGPLKEVAKVAYVAALAQRQALALANLGDPAESIIGMLPV